MSDSIWTIGSCDRSSDYAWASKDDPYVEIDEEEGFFTSADAAQARADELNEPLRKQWEKEHAKAQQQYAEKLASWEEQRKQIEFLTANGFAPGRGAPKPQEPKQVPYEDWLWRSGGRSTYEVVELKAAKPK